MKLLLPLKFYDTAGRVIPSAATYLCLLFLCRNILIFIASITVRENNQVLLAFFYPETTYLYISLGIALPALLAWLIIGFREKIWLADKSGLFLLFKPLILVSILMDLAFQLVLAKIHYWAFSWVIALTVLSGALCLYFVLKDKHLKLMLLDWRK